jgi:hypothetical protein
VVTEPTTAQYLRLRRDCAGTSREDEKVEDLPPGHVMTTSDTDQPPPRYLLILTKVSPSISRQRQDVQILGDTGATVCLVQKGLLSPEDRVLAEEQKRFSTADGSHLDGGEYGAFLTLKLPAQKLCGTQVVLHTRDFFYEADISVPMIISYGYMEKHRCSVVPHLRSLVAWPRTEWEGVETFPLLPANLRLSHDPLSICPRGSGRGTEGCMAVPEEDPMGDQHQGQAQNRRGEGATVPPPVPNAAQEQQG